MEWLSSMLHAFAKPLKWWVVVASWEQGMTIDSDNANGERK